MLLKMHNYCSTVLQLRGQIHTTTYGPLTDMALYVMLLMGGQMGGGSALEISTFLGPKCHSHKGSMPFHRAQQSLDTRAQPPFHLPS
jgi:hypothetical protein